MSPEPDANIFSRALNYRLSKRAALRAAAGAGIALTSGIVGYNLGQNEKQSTVDQISVSKDLIYSFTIPDSQTTFSFEKAWDTEKAAAIQRVIEDTYWPTVRIFGKEPTDISGEENILVVVKKTTAGHSLRVHPVEGTNHVELHLTAGANEFEIANKLAQLCWGTLPNAPLANTVLDPLEDGFADAAAITLGKAEKNGDQLALLKEYLGFPNLDPKIANRPQIAHYYGGINLLRDTRRLLTAIAFADALQMNARFINRSRRGLFNLLTSSRQPLQMTDNDIRNVLKNSLKENEFGNLKAEHHVLASPIPGRHLLVIPTRSNESQDIIAAIFFERSPGATREIPIGGTEVNYLIEGDGKPRTTSAFTSKDGIITIFNNSELERARGRQITVTLTSNIGIPPERTTFVA